MANVALNPVAVKRVLDLCDTDMKVTEIDKEINKDERLISYSTIRRIVQYIRNSQEISDKLLSEIERAMELKEDENNEPLTETAKIKCDLSTNNKELSVEVVEGNFQPSAKQVSKIRKIMNKNKTNEAYFIISNNGEDIDFVPQKRRGRPKGSKNKTKDLEALADKLVTQRRRKKEENVYEVHLFMKGTDMLDIMKKMKECEETNNLKLEVLHVEKKEI